ncbi:MAG TPA: efflux RND transporter permease subunit [Halothiobacillaceae bacterium]|nr:efflux RND transporter permease subunit [Halothiobacillaceae bacterium]
MSPASKSDQTQNEQPTSLLGRFAKHRVAPHVIMLLMVLVGIFAITRMNVQFFPNYAPDIVTVSVTWSGASAEDVERSITDPLEERLRSVPNVKNITSTSAQSIASIQVEFAENTDPIAALDDVRERVDTFRNLPADAETPQVSRIARFDPVGNVLIYGDFERDAMREWIDQFKRELLIAGIDDVNVIGLPERQISIEIKPDKLAQIGLSIDELGEIISAQSQDLPAGQFGALDGGRELRAVEQGRDIHDFANMTVISDAQTNILLGDIANIVWADRNNETLITYNGQPAVELSLRRSEDGDTIQSARILNQWVEEIRPTLPQGLEIKLYDQSWELLRDRINLLISNGVSGLVLVLLLLYLFLPGRVAFWVAMGIPAAFMAALGILWLAGGSLNIISLFALIMALGVIVDDAIVVGENADARRRDGATPFIAAQGAVHRMFWPVMASSMTTVAAFMPLLVVGGIIGNILGDIPFVMICVILASLVESLLVLPGHLRMAFAQQDRKAQSVVRNNGIKARFERGFEWFKEHPFRRAARWSITHRGVTLAAAVGSLFIAVGLIAGGRIGFTFFPAPEPQMLYVNATFVAGTDRNTVATFLKSVEEAIDATEKQLDAKLVNTAVVRLGSTVGEDGSAAKGDQLGSLKLELTPPDERDIRNTEFISTLREHIDLPPGLESFSITERQSGPPGADFTVRFTGGSAETLKAAALELTTALENFTGVLDVTDDLPYGREQITYKVNHFGQSLGLNTSNVGNQLRAAFDGDLVQIFQSGADEVEVRALLPQMSRDRIAVLRDLTIRTPDGRTVLLDQVVDFSAQRGFEAIRHANAERAVQVMAELDSELTSAGNLATALERRALPALAERYDINYSFEGLQADQRDTMNDMRFGLFIGLALMYFLLVWVFAAWTTPFIVMAIIPFGLVGAILGHWVMNIDLTILSLFGLFGLAGIVVNNAIILVAFYQSQLENGLAPQQALEQAVTQRLRAVLLTSLTTISGLTPLLFETSFQAQFLIPMATSIAFGLGYSTLLVLFVIPALLSLRESLRGRFVNSGSANPA